MPVNLVALKAGEVRRMSDNDVMALTMQDIIERIGEYIVA